jgi:hypothetical protein
VHFALRALLDFGFQLIDFRPFAPDDDSRARRINTDHKLVGRTLDVNAIDPS